jgi:hypothetical protein
MAKCCLHSGYFGRLNATVRVGLNASESIVLDDNPWTGSGNRLRRFQVPRHWATCSLRSVFPVVHCAETNSQRWAHEAAQKHSDLTRPFWSCLVDRCCWLLTNRYRSEQSWRKTVLWGCAAYTNGTAWQPDRISRDRQ